MARLKPRVRPLFRAGSERRRPGIRFYFAHGQVLSLASARRLLIPSSCPCIIAPRMSEPKKPQVLPTGPERELQIYALGLGGGKPSVPVPLDLLEQKAKETLSPCARTAKPSTAGGSCQGCCGMLRSAT